MNDVKDTYERKIKSLQETLDRQKNFIASLQECEEMWRQNSIKYEQENRDLAG